MIDFFKKAVNDTTVQVYKYGYAYVWKKTVMLEVAKNQDFEVIKDVDFWHIKLVDNTKLTK